MSANNLNSIVHLYVITVVKLTFILSCSFACFYSYSEAAVLPQEVCQSAVKTGDYQKALGICTLQWPLVEQMNSPKAVIDYYFSVIDLYHYLGVTVEEANYLHRVENHPYLNLDMDIQYRFYRKKGRQFMRQGVYESAIDYFEKGLSLAVKQENLVWISKSHNDVGTVYRLSNNYQSAISSYEKSLKAKNQLGDLYLIANTQRNIGIVYTHLEEHHKALNFYEQALGNFVQYSQVNGHDNRVSHDISHIYQDLALAYSKVDNARLSKKYKQLIVDQFNSIKSISGQTMAMMNIAQLDIYDQLYSVAISRLSQAIEMAGEQVFEHSPELYLHLSISYQLNDQLSSAIDAAEQGLVLISAVKNHAIKMRLYRLLSELHQSTNKDLSIHYMQVFQNEREQFFKNKYDDSVKTRQHRFELMLVEKNLVDEKYNNLLKSTEISSLRQKIVISFMVFVLIIGTIFFLLFRRRNERHQLLNTIKSHQQQLLLLNDKQTSKDTDDREMFKRLLVKTMIILVETWEKHTGTNRVELAEKSGAWTITIDNGTLRTRSLDKYMSLGSIPKFPRWRHVIKTCHFLLSDETLPSEDRSVITKKLDAVMQMIKEKSLK